MALATKHMQPDQLAPVRHVSSSRRQPRLGVVADALRPMPVDLGLEGEPPVPSQTAIHPVDPASCHRYPARSVWWSSAWRPVTIHDFIASLI